MSELPPDEMSWELASAYLDNEATPDERARVEADPSLLALVHELGGVQTLLAEPVGAPPADLVARMIATIPVPLRRRGRALAWVGGLAAAATVAAFVGLGGLVTTGSDKKAASGPTAEQAGAAATTAASAAAGLAVEDKAIDTTAGDSAPRISAGASTTLVATSAAASSTAPTAAATTAPPLLRSDFDTLRDLTAAKSASPSIILPTCARPPTANVFIGLVTLRGEQVELFRSDTGAVLVAIRPQGCVVVETVGT